jgi:ATP-grasp domain, R2K clade family 3
MHWILQDKFDREPGIEEVVHVLERAGIPFSEHKVFHFIDKIEPDISPSGKVIVFGSYAMRHVAKRKGWKPGCFDIGDLTMRECLTHWQAHMLNSDAVFCPFGSAQPTIDPFFIRPCADSKYFTGVVMSRRDLAEWQEKIIGLGDDEGSGLRGNTEVLWCAPKAIQREYRLWIIRGTVATASQYRIGDRVMYSSVVDSDAILFGEEMAALWTPAEAFVLDVCLHQGQWKIVEINVLNAARLYAANVGKLVDALAACRTWRII